MDVTVYQTVTGEDGTITAYITISDPDTGKKIKNACVQGVTQADFKTNIQAKLDRISNENTEKESAFAMVTAAATSIKEEETTIKEEITK